MYAVVFADIAGSTRIYEKVGDEAAKALVLETERVIAGTISRLGGHVQDIAGDEVMFRFEDIDHAVSCACEIQHTVGSISAGKSLNIAVRIGLHYGPAIVEDDRIFGDTVNTAARMAEIAQAGQIITTAEAVRGLSATLKGMVRRFDEVRVKGKHQELVVYEVLWRHTGITKISRTTGAVEAPQPTLTLQHRDRCYQIHPWQGVFTIGREDGNDLVVAAAPVSRKHATIDFARGRFVFTDTSTNGSYVQAHGGPCVFFRREPAPLVGTGRIGLGAPPVDVADCVLNFTCH
jgi:hypothetical protein